MNYPSTLTEGRNVSLGGFVTNIESSHGVLIDGGSTGGLIQPVGADANISLRVKGKGTGGLVLGDSSQGMTLGQGLAIKGVFSTTFAWTAAILSSLRAAEISISTAVGDIMPGDLVQVELYGNSTETIVSAPRTSTAVTSRVTVLIGNLASTATSTMSGTGRVTWFDLT
jgi:hypothetical protein